MIVVDASVLIGFLDAEDNYHLAAQTLLADVEDDLGVNSLTLAEVLVAPARSGRLEMAQRALRDLEVAELPFPAETALRLAQLRADTGLKLPDCCVLMAAEELGASAASFDGRLRRAAASRNVPVLPT